MSGMTAILGKGVFDMLCKQCGTKLLEGEKFCSACGTAVPVQTEQSQDDLIAEITRIDAEGVLAPDFDYTEQPAAPVRTAPAREREITEADLPEQYKPMSPWAYFGLQILYAIPIVGFIFLIIHSVSTGNMNRRNFARSYWCALIIAACAAAVALVLAFLIAFLSRTGSAMY